MIFYGIFDTLPYKTRLQPYASYVTLTMVIILALTNGFTVFVGGSFTGPDFVAAYITLPLFATIYFSHKLYTKNWTWLNPVETIDVISGLDEVEATELKYPNRVPRNLVEKIWYWIA
jgi:amino acid transporter